MSAESLERLARKLRRMTLVERQRLPCLDARRAEIIVPGALVLAYVLDAVEAENIVISDFGVREGLVTDYLVNHAREISALGRFEDLKLRSVMQLLGKFQPEDRHARHAQQVARLALALFDGLSGVHPLDGDDREILHYAALLHDVGAVIGYDGHAEHSYYIVKHGNLRGLSADEVERIALIARYHGKTRPRKRDPIYRSLDKRRRRAVRWLAAILRIAEGLDRTHYQLVQELRVVRRRKRLSILLIAKRGARLELWAARRRTDLLSKLLSLDVRVAIDPKSEGVRRGKREPVEKRATEPSERRAVRSGVGREPITASRERARAPGTLAAVLPIKSLRAKPVAKG